MHGKRRVAAFTAVSMLCIAGIWQIASAQPATPRRLPPNPDAGLTDAQRAERYAQLKAAGEARRKAFVEEFVRQNADLRSLPRTSRLAYYPAPLADLLSAVTAAEVVVVGTVESTQLQYNEPARVSVKVERAIKGSVPTTVMVRQTGEPVKDSAGKLFLGEDENAPLLLPGDRVVLFLSTWRSPGEYAIQSFTGWFKIERGRVVALAGNPFSASVSGQSEPEFAARIAQLLSR